MEIQIIEVLLYIVTVATLHTYLVVMVASMCIMIINGQPVILGFRY